MSNPLNNQRISIGQLESPQDVAQLVKHLQNLYNGTIPVTTGAGAPTVPPAKISHQYIDTTNKQVYVAIGNSQVSDWIKVS